MAKIIIAQHSPYEPLGIIIDTLKQKKIRLKYANFHRIPNHPVHIERYDGLIVLGGPQNPNELKKHPHLSLEINLIQQALEKNIPVLGICLGSQLLNLALGGSCYCLKKEEIGWSNVYKLSNDPSFEAFAKCTRVFQWHRYASRPPGSVDTILENECCIQAFSYQKKFIGLQFHLEVDVALIKRWLEHPDYLTHLKSNINEPEIARMQQDTKRELEQSMQIGRSFFNQFCQRFTKYKHTLASRHADRGEH